LRDVREILDTIRAVCGVEPITSATHERGLTINERYGFSLYDSMIVASALIVDVKVLYAEDLQHGQVIDGQLRVIDPFRKS
jgi:predicted nucleic acid-binding protein